MAIVAGAVRRHLAEKGLLPDRPALAFTAATNRKAGDTRLWGTAATSRPVELPTHLADPLERLRAAHAQSAAAKADVAARSVQMEDLFDFAPPIILTPMLRLTRLVGQRIGGGVIVSDVMGPKQKRYIGGMGIENFLSCGHLKYAAGVNITVWIYNKMLNFAVYSCSRTLPDVELLTQQIQSSFEELRAAAGMSRNPSNGTERPEPAQANTTAAEGREHMYEMTEVVGEDGVRQQNPTPNIWLMAAEFPRWASEVVLYHAASSLLPKRDLGQGRPVLVVPGIGANDGMTKRLRNHLRAHGFHVHGWGLGRNKGLTDQILNGLSDRLVAVHERHDQPVILVGWSFGGLLCRWLAHEHTEKVRHVVTLGAPWRAEGERTRVTGLFKSFVRVFGVTDHAEDALQTLRQPLPVPTTAIFSRSDGLLHWRSCTVDGPDTENVAVHSSHVGLVSSPLVLAALTDRLAHIDSAHVPFGWRGLVQRMVS